MFNYKFALSKLPFQKQRKQKPPVDLGSMYYLYPSEAANYFDTQSIGIFQKVLEVIRDRFKKPDQEVEYYKNCGF